MFDIYFNDIRYDNDILLNTGCFFTVPPLEMAKCQITQKIPSK